MSPWPVASRARLIVQGQQLAKRFGISVAGCETYTVAIVPKSLARSFQGRSPLSLRISFIAKQGGQSAEVGFDSAGAPTFWHVPDSDKAGTPPRTSAADTAQSAFRTIAGPEAGTYKDAGHFMGRHVEDEDYLWRKSLPAQSDVKDTITVSMKNSVLSTVERKISRGSNKDDDDSDSPGYWDILSGIFGIASTVALVAIISVYVLWLARRAVSHQFALRLAGVTLLLVVTAMLDGVDWQKAHSLSQHQSLPFFSALFEAALVMVFVAVGRGISSSARPKWMSLEQLCRLAPLSKSTGESIAVGFLFAPLLAAIPFLVTGCGLFPHAWVLPDNAKLLYSSAPLLDSLDIPTDIYLLGFFGFVFPSLDRVFRHRWLRWLILIMLGTVFFTDQTRIVSGPVAAPLLAGFLTLVLFWFVWARFDVLALLVLHFSGSNVTSLLILAQKGEPFWSLAAGLALPLVFALWVYRQGQDVTQGDRLATVPGLIGFRAEREKLQAEFSVARRAQQDMLPPTPVIAGYSLAASCTPSLEVGGDLYDFLRLPDGRVGIGVADVSGKGVPAALYMTLTKGLLASVTRDCAQLIPVVEEVNRHLHGVTRKKVFVTMALGFLDVESRVLQCIRAGHNPVVWRRATEGRTVLVSPGGLGLGITASHVFSTQLKMEEMRLSEGDAVVFYSDGITEAMNSELELFGEQRLMNAVDRTDCLDAIETRDSILNEVMAFLGDIHPQDDMTLVVLRVGERAELAHTAAEMRG